MRSSFFAVFLALASVGVAASGGTARAEGPSLPANALPVPLVRQSTPYSCGAAALEAVLFYWRAYEGNESALRSLLGTTEADGTAPQAIVDGARRFGLEAELRTGLEPVELERALERGDTAIVDLQAWREDRATPWRDRWGDGHYVVLVGADAGYLYFMDPSTPASYAYIPREEFLERWHDELARADGSVERVQHLAILIRGKDPLKTMPGPLIRIERR